jgi:hypothetical protein
MVANNACSICHFFSLSLWERVGERAYACIVSYAPLPRPFSQREKGEMRNDKRKMVDYVARQETP